MRVLHPLFVHLHVAFLLMAFVAMYAWLFRGLATSVFEDRTHRFARANTWAGIVTVALSMVAGIRDGMFGTVAQFRSASVGGWLLVKAVLATFLLVNYGVFLYHSSKKPRYLQEDGRRTAWCLGTQLVGIVVVAFITAIGTMLVYYQDLLPRFPWPLE
ncbi:MAG: hypothetical protein HY700_12935 [Gemmatimonadetes bacterium]|nr:hypothetical protein [Gemmatimonadota bacterium]